MEGEQGEVCVASVYYLQDCTNRQYWFEGGEAEIRHRTREGSIDCTDQVFDGGWGEMNYVAFGAVSRELIRAFEANPRDERLGALLQRLPSDDLGGRVIGRRTLGEGEEAVIQVFISDPVTYFDPNCPIRPEWLEIRDGFADPD